MDNQQNPQSVNYAGFWKRLGAHLLDVFILLPYTVLTGWLSIQYQSAMLYLLVPCCLFGLFYDVYLVKRFGATPGKLLMGLQIRKVDLSPVDYQEAFLRMCVTWILSIIMSVGTTVAMDQFSDFDFRTLGFIEKMAKLDGYTPKWAHAANILLGIWAWSELLVLLTNQKRRGLNDFIAGTVVIQKPSESVQTPVTPVNSPA